ncbi:hypothetical protein H5410_026498 [Solanum commersonii]|uniref:Uncharacterized protein n=1 Tax=Solanum commersonii TaxID=4109 RepID=A0A9J5Z1P9_SOLCO|nr:hypothetical protein H5410_026498 [Solanum commersonii]
MEPVDPEGKIDPFLGSNKPRADLFWPIFFRERLLKPQQWSQLVLRVKSAHFQIQMSRRAVYGVLVIRDFEFFFCQKFSWTSVKTLAVSQLVPRGKPAYFQVQTSLIASKAILYRFSCAIILGDSGFQNFLGKSFHGRPLRPCNGASWSEGANRPIFKFKRAKASREPIGLAGQTSLFSRSNNPRARKTRFYQFSCAIFYGFLTLAMEIVGLEGNIGSFSSSNEPRAGKKWSQLVLTGKPIHFKVQTSPRAGKTKFYQFLCAIDHGVLLIRNFNFFWLKFFIDVIEPVGLEG